MKELHWYDSFFSVILALIIWRKRIVKLVLILRIVRSVVGIFEKKESLMEFENIKKAIVIAAKLGNVAGKVFEDGKVSVADLSILPEFVMLFPAFIAVDWTKMIPEAKELKAEQSAELVALFNSEFDIPQEAQEHTIESVLAIVSQLVSVIASLIAIFKKPAPAV